MKSTGSRAEILLDGPIKLMTHVFMTRTNGLCGEFHSACCVIKCANGIGFHRVHSSTCFKSNKIIIRRQNAAIILAKHVRSCRVCSVLSPLKPSVPFLGPLIKQFEREQRSNLRRNFAVATLLTASIFWSFFANFRNTLSTIEKCSFPD